MDLLNFFKWLNADILALPTTLLFFGAGLVLTIKTGFLQLRAFPKFISLVTKGFARKKKSGEAGEMKTINPFHALFTAMGTVIGMGNVVSPSIAIMMGGPGALFWLVAYIFLGAATKFTEVTFALHTRIKTAEGHIIGGPMVYLKAVSPFLAYWYGIITIFLYAAWSGFQANTLAQIFALEGVSEIITGLLLAVIVLIVVSGGATRVGYFASKLVPFMFILYVSFAASILFKDIYLLKGAIILVGKSIFSVPAAMGGFLGATAFQAMRHGIYRGIYITESGLGTSSIPHSMADTQKPTDQGILAMFSAAADIFLCLLSGLLVLVTGIWLHGDLRSTLIYEVFKTYTGSLGQFVLIVSVGLFVLTTVIGNSFNGLQSFASLTKHRWLMLYLVFSLLNIILGSLVKIGLVLEATDTLLALVAIPNIIGILILAFRKPEVLKV